MAVTPRLPEASFYMEEVEEQQFEAGVIEEVPQSEYTITNPSEYHDLPLGKVVLFIVNLEKVSKFTRKTSETEVRR